ncbi:hypothetical protein CkaCkLH20_13102 [Colletotrichum karsti]|uniref:Apple domain-containing protein n=1 Tax=Colletotrichum karsti TaxID=1095194 RepID=A0A9P6I045_9PEZI|nr:uncharacterized protein CkaCkLH20_13102 [Colletotrichum karsti]KAF9869440.1 hypothetical protein CkaCkLH20_13102 [Colletotrichum karsti]
MHYPLLLGAVVLLTGEARAAPKPQDDQMAAHVVQRRTFQLEPDPGAGANSERDRPMYHQNGTNATTPTASGTGGMTSRTFTLPHNTSSTSMHAECPMSVVTSTTTVDVTFYVTATTSYGSNLTSYYGTGTAHTSVVSSQSGLNSTVSSTSMRLSSGLISSANSSTTVAPAASESPCSEDVFSTLASHNTTSRVGNTLITSSPIIKTTSSTLPSRSTEPCDDDLGSTSRLNSTATASSTLPGSTVESPSVTPCDNESGTGSSLTSTQSSTGHANQTSSYRTISGKPQGSSTALYTSTSTSLDEVSSTVSTVESTTAKPCNDESSTPTSVAPSDASSYTSQNASASSTIEASPSFSSDLTTSPVTAATLTSIGTSASLSNPMTSAAVTSIPPESCVIDTSMAPVTSAPLTSVPSSTLVPTKTVCQNDAPTGKPMPGNHHCGVHGLPVGNYFLARFVENSPGVPVTLEGCYQFCASVMNATDGCKSYRFYPEKGLNVPRCDLYGSNVAYALDSIDNDHPDLWFDLACGSPSDPNWVHLPGMTRLRDLGLLE